VALAEKDFVAARRSALNLSLGLRGAAGYNRYQLAVLAHQLGQLRAADTGYHQALDAAKQATIACLRAPSSPS
jgi:hypothetical protein